MKTKSTAFQECRVLNSLIHFVLNSPNVLDTLTSVEMAISQRSTAVREPFSNIIGVRLRESQPCFTIS